MNNTAKQVTAILSQPYPAAPITTHALAVLGNGSMHNGIVRIINYYSDIADYNLWLGRIQGCLVGTIGAATLVGGISLIVHGIKEGRAEKEGKEIKNTLQNSNVKTRVVVCDVPSDTIKPDNVINDNND